MPKIPSSPSGKIVVLVDDEISYIDLLEQLLNEHLACPVHGFTKPADALRAMPALDVGLIVTDYQMPEMNGLEFINSVQKMKPGIPVIMITGYHLKFTERELAEVPSLKVIVRKPFKWSALAAEVVKYWPDLHPPKVIASGAPLQNL
ncbi:MAG: rpfG 2 [Lacunisphaera sp.]|nr:rpfG 2 [Lacunisphaera sp.]